jgi:hypothetical protein
MNAAEAQSFGGVFVPGTQPSHPLNASSQSEIACLENACTISVVCTG